MIKLITDYALSLPRLLKRVLAVLLDILLCMFALWIALSLHLEDFVIFKWQHVTLILFSVFIAIPNFYFWGLYRGIFRYSGNKVLILLVKAITNYIIIYSSLLFFVSFEQAPLSIGIMQPIFLFLLVGLSRWLVKIWLGKHFSRNTELLNKKGVIIYGAGNAGRQLASNLTNSPEFKFISFIDDNKNFWGATLDGFQVFSPSSISKLIETTNPKELWLAMPSASGERRRALINSLRNYSLHVRTVSSLSYLATGRVLLSDVRELNINEFLNREAVKPNKVLLQKCVFNKVVLVTGAGGSIGCELCRQILGQKPKSILLVENSELALYNIHIELQSIIKEQTFDSPTELIPLLVNIQDEDKLNRIFNTWRPQTVYHTAAYKHVPLVEHNIISGITNNVIGTLICAKISIAYKVDHFVLVSTDKAVRPTNIMGASKRLAEMGLQSLANNTKNLHTCLSMVRFGNVLGSSGSVVPLFRKQIKSGGPITLTHRDVTRYFMTIQEAAQLVIQAGAMAKGGEVFLLDMGRPVRIEDLARNMIETAGLKVKDHTTPQGDIEIKITGMRPGEKLFEELLIGKESLKTIHPRILQANETYMSKKDFDILTEKLQTAIKENNVIKIRNLLKKTVSGYIPSKDIVDLISKTSTKKGLVES